MKIAIIGAGNVGRALGNGWAAKGHSVVYGVRDPASPKLADIDRSRFPVKPSAEAAAEAEVVVLATPWGGTRAAIDACSGFTGKIVLDATNPLLPMLAGLDHAEGKSGGQRVQEWAPQAKVVKIFNTTGYNNMTNPKYGADGVMMLYCGDDTAAKGVAKGLAEDLGFNAVDFGPMANAGYSENVAMSWIWLAVKSGQGREIGYVLKKR